MATIDLLLERWSEIKAFSIILSEVGWRTYQLDGGYKEYRNSVVKFLKILVPN